jgi:hypothetical protein
MKDGLEARRTFNLLNQIKKVRHCVFAEHLGSFAKHDMPFLENGGIVQRSIDAKVSSQVLYQRNHVMQAFFFSSWITLGFTFRSLFWSRLSQSTSL